MDDWPTRILVGTDGSEEAALALRAAADICEKTGAELHVIHAWHAPVLTSTGHRLPDGYEHEARDLLTAQVKQLEATGKAIAEAHLRLGPPVDEILDFGEELDASLIVAGRSTQRSTSSSDTPSSRNLSTRTGHSSPGPNGVRPPQGSLMRSIMASPL
jgi:nucleotide-binding universal stress UspA family protein